ncbi:MAG: heme o synthase [Vicingus serpentipes]|nr:heme o synthase [Vicingus serpentipes]
MSVAKASEISVVNFSEKLKCYAQLFKLRLTSFVVISAVFGYFIGAATYNVGELFFLIIGGFLVTGASNAFNQIIEKNYDKLMDRTKNRPLPSNKLSLTETTWVASIIGLLGVSILWLFLNPLSGVLGALAIFMYAAIYTPLKRITPFSVFVGAFPGAIPPMLGWVAATGSFSLGAGILFFIQFVWQFPHFWAIAWRLNGDYQKAGFKMLPFNRKNKVSSFILGLSSLALLFTSFIPEFFAIATRITTVGLLFFSALMVYPAIKLVQTNDDKFALRIMLMSYLYLIGSLAILLIDKLISFS